MKKLLAFLVNPFVLPVIPTVIIILLLPFNYDRYVLEIDSSKKLNQNVFEWYDDITLDGNSERLYLVDHGNFSWVAIYDHNETLFNQWNFLGNFDFTYQFALSLTGDYDGCGQKEIFFLTLRNDSIFLQSIKGLENNHLAIEDRFITKVGAGKGKPDPRLLQAEMQDLDGDGKKELIFGLGSGFSLNPRSIFGYYIEKDSLVRSPESYFHISQVFQVDITGDGQKEIIPMGMATSNVSPEQAKYHDHSNWLMVFDQNLNFLFEPVEIPGKTQSFVPIIIEKDGEIHLKGITQAHAVEGNSQVYSFSESGEIVEIKDLGLKAGTSSLQYDRNGNPLYVFSNQWIGTVLYNEQLNFKKHITESFLSIQKSFDFDGDGVNELIAVSPNQSKVYVFRQGMKQQVSVKIDWVTTNPYLLTIKESTTAPPKISLQLGRDHYLLSYGPNPAFYLNFLYYLLIYTGMLAFAFSSRRIQKKQIQRRYETEKKITELQLSMVKTQLDPHFTMNAINAIIHSVNKNEKEKANENLHRFSRLYRSLLLSADKTRRSLEEELNFCRDYLELEKARFDHAFDFEINFAENVDRHQQVPKMIVQTHAENAVKHGLSAVPQGGKLRIDITTDGQQLEIEISDNGIGRLQAAKKAGTSTGKGLALMKEFFKLYKKYYKQDISADIQDIFDEQGKASGTKVIIKISRHDESN